MNHPLFTEPLWRPEDLGKPIPDSPHAVSVALPTWQHVVGYEEGDPAVVDAMQLGYPRFVHHPAVERLFAQCRERLAGPDETAYVFPAERVAQRCVDFVRAQSGQVCRVEPYGIGNVHAVIGPEDAAESMKFYWQHSGEIISSRWAEALVAGRGDSVGGESAKEAIRNRIAELTGASAKNIFLYSTGMAALAAAQRALHARRPEGKTVQLGFPYVDLIKLQQKIGPGAHFFTENDHSLVPEFEGAIADGNGAGVFADSPGNPLLGCAHFPKLYTMLRDKNIPLVVDETIGGYANVDVLPHVDIAMTSLTKYFSGVSNTMGGALILNHASPLIGELSAALQTDFEDTYWGEDAHLVEEYSRDYTERIVEINANAEALAEFLDGHPAVADVYYPKLRSRENYDAIKKPGGGYGGLLSFVLRDPEKHSPACYDALRICKGPSFGTNYTLACPYVLLAHYKELDWVESQGLSRWLIRVGVGMEDRDDLIARFDEALRSC